MTPGSYERLSTQDSSFIHFEGPGTHMHVSAVAIFDASEATSQLDIGRLRSHVESRLNDLPRYRQRLDFMPLRRHPIWVDDERFNLLYHVRHTALPSPGSERQLKDLAGRVLSQQLDREKPLWEMWLVEGLEGGRLAVIAKVHHCLIDGIAGVGLLLALLSTSPHERIEPAPSWRPRRRPGQVEFAAAEIARRANLPASMLRSVRRAFQSPEQASATLADGADAMWQALNAGLRRPGNTPLNQPIGTHRRVDWCQLDLGAIKELKKRLDGTVNDVVLTLVGGAVRRLLKRRRTRLRDLDFRVVVPVNMRSEPEAATSGNRVSAWFLSLPVAERNAIRRFERVREQTARLKGSKTAHGIDLFARIVDWTGSDLLTFWGVRLASTLRPYNMIVTNVPGPQFPLFLLGARLEALYPQLPLFERQGLGVAAASYRGGIGFGVVADWDLVPDLSTFVREIEAEFAELRDAAGRR